MGRKGERVEITLKVKDYLSEDEIREMCVEEVRYAIRGQLQKEADIDRILVNRSYEYVFKMVQETLGINADKFKSILNERIADLLNDSGTLKFIVFRRADAWTRSESIACRWLDEALAESKPKVVEMVNKVIEEYPFYEIKEGIADTIYECVMNALSNPQKQQKHKKRADTNYRLDDEERMM